MDSSTATKLRQTVADFFQVEEAKIGPSFSLQARQGSIARSALDAAIRRRVGLKSAAVYSARTFGELAGELGGGGDSSEPTSASASASALAAPVVPSSSESGLASCGIDIELIEHLPVAADPWEDGFYRANFAPSEIAYCLRQPEPALHFAARWCAKEALKKADRSFQAVEGKDIEVAADEAGAPHLVYHQAGRSAARLPHALSLSHTTHAAVAVVVRVAAARSADEPSTASALIPAPVAAEIPRPSSRRWVLAFVLLDLVTLALAVVAIGRTYPALRWPFSPGVGR